MAMMGLRCLIDLRWLNVWNGCRRVGAWRAARTFACIAMCVCVCLCLNLKCLLESANYWRLIQYEVVCSLIIMCYFAVQINDTLQWRWWVCVAWLTFVGWMYWMDVVVLALDEQHVSLLILLCVCVCLCWNLRRVLESANYWRSIQSEVVRNLIIKRYFAVQI